MVRSLVIDVVQIGQNCPNGKRPQMDTGGYNEF